MWSNKNTRYGSSRLGMETSTVELIATSVLSPYWADASVYTTNADNRVYELSNHLGNVLATFTARKLPLTEAGVVVGFAPHLTSLSDYYPFGSGMEGRTVTEGYRYGFNTQEKDDEIYGKGNSYTAEFWQYDARLGRRWNLDPKSNPMLSNFAAFSNNPLLYTDSKGDTVRLFYEYKTGDGKLQRVEALRIETDALEASFTINQVSFPRAVSSAFGALSVPVVIDGSCLDDMKSWSASSDARMISISASAGFFAAGSIGLDFVTINKGIDSDRTFVYFTVGIGFGGGAGVSVVTGGIDVHSKFELDFDRYTFEGLGMMITYSGGVVAGSDITTYSPFTEADRDACLFGFCPDDSQQVYSGTLIGGGVGTPASIGRYGTESWLLGEAD